VRESLRSDAGMRDNRKENSDLRREHFFPLRTLKEMERKMKVSQQLHSDDATSLMLLVQQLQAEEYDSAIQTTRR